MNERRPKVRKTGSQEDSLESNPDSYRDESQKPEEENTSAPDSYRDDIPQSEIEKKSEVGMPKSEVKKKSEEKNTSAPDSYRDDIPTSEIKEPLTTHNSPLTTMEVHHHPDLHHKRKAWKEYVLEGLMIFLAVMMGFVAESLRENIADRNREKGFMVSMIEDLKSDTAMLSSNMHFRDHRIQMIDSLIFLLNPSSLSKNGNTIYFYARVISPPQRINPNDRTIQQLKSSGSLRLINNWNISNSIMAYDQKMRVQLLEMDEEQILRDDYRKLAMKVFDTRVFNSMVAGDKILRPTNNPKLFSTDAALLNEYIGSAQYLKKSDIQQASRAAELLTQAKQLMALIKHEYHLENE
jgi:hypothetical protein